MTSSCFCRAELQRIYDTETSTMRDLAFRFGISTATLCKWFRSLRIKRHVRGGNYGRSKEQQSQRSAANRANGDAGWKAAPCRRVDCVELRRDSKGHVLLCVETKDRVCGECERGNEAGKQIVAGIKGGSLAPAQVGSW